MKKKLSLVLAIMLMLGLALTLTACSEKEGDDAVKGTWKATSVEMMGITMTAQEAGMENFTLEFNGNTTVKLSFDGNSGKTNYTLKDNVVTFTAEDVTFTGNLDGNKLVFDDFMGMGMKFTFERQ